MYALVFKMHDRGDDDLAKVLNSTDFSLTTSSVSEAFKSTLYHPGKVNLFS